MTEKTIYEQVKYSYKGFHSLFNQHILNIVYERPFYTPDYSHLDRIIVSMEFEEFKVQYPDTYKKYLGDFLTEYLQLQSETSQVVCSNENMRYIPSVSKFCKDIDYIVDYLEEMVTPEDNLPETYLKFEKFQPIEKLLIWHYLNLDSLKLYQYNLKAGVFFLSRLLDINPESIKKPLSKLNIYTASNELTPSQARSIYPTLEKVKAFFDESELSKLSTVIEARITELQMKSGKV